MDKIVPEPSGEPPGIPNVARPAPVLSPESDACIVCERVPSTPVTLRRQVGLVFAGRTETMNGRLCRDCGTAMFRDFMNRTLLSGWWGIQSFFKNFYAIWLNLRARRSVLALGSPGAPPANEVPLSPLDPGRPLYRRGGVLLVAAIVIWLVVAGTVGVLKLADRNESGEIVKGGTLEVKDLRVGDCFNDPELLASTATAKVVEVKAVPCREAHDFEIFARTELRVPEDASYPGEGSLQREASGICAEELPRFVGLSIQETRLDGVYFYPLAGSWELGDRTVSCAVGDPARQVSGSLRDARR